MAVLVAVVLAVGCGVATRWIRSPAQVAAEAAPPGATVLSARVTMQVVQNTIVGRGTVVASVPMSVAAPTATEVAPVISAIGVPAGGTVTAGDVVVAVSGRPVIVLPGAIPAYRDLRPGDEGPDVRQLQDALASIGLAIGRDAAGSFGAGTREAVRALYVRAGYQVPSTSGFGDPPSPEVTSARAAVTSAERGVEDAQVALTAAQAAVPSDASGAELLLGRARTDREAARAILGALSATTGPMLPRAEVAFLPTVPAMVMSVGGALGGAPSSLLVTFNGGDLVVDMLLDPGQAALVRTGMAVTLDDEASGWTGTATVASVGLPVAVDGAPPKVTVRLAGDAPLEARLAGLDLRVTVSSASSGGPVLAVPVAAVTASADRTTYVVRLTPSGDQEKVVVTVGVSGDGSVQVTPVSGVLVEGDFVVTSQ